MITQKDANKIMDMIGSVFKVVGESINSSGVWLETGPSTIFTTPGIKAELIFRDGRIYGPVLPSTPINADFINNGSGETIVKIFSPEEETKPLFSVHYHSGTHSGLHIQKGRVREYLPCTQFTDFGTLGSSLFLQTQNRSEVIDKMLSVVNNH